ncbi:hypothetical protein GCM10009787_67380 [Streptomyces bangladeshensis]|uniref:Uncharacterized protein n=1 Tax=Streptomyces bangladeshensis TaxID=295352 RepID=A0ABN3C3J3_9ACTN
MPCDITLGTVGAVLTPAGSRFGAGDSTSARPEVNPRARARRARWVIALSHSSTKGEPSAPVPFPGAGTDTLGGTQGIRSLPLGGRRDG